MDEEAKAIEEIAKTTGKAIDSATKAGKFISQYLNGSLIEAFGIFQDKLKYIRWERQVRLWDRATEFLHQRGLEKPSRAVPMSIGIPILQHGSMEEDNTAGPLGSVACKCGGRWKRNNCGAGLYRNSSEP